VHEVLAGVVDPPGPEEVLTLVDTVVSGIVGDDFDVMLDRAAAFAHIVGVGRAQVDSGDPASAARLVDMAIHLRKAATLERAGTLP
jgi:membrane-associated protease RseP (regulator of RpoE activity)